MNRKELKQLEKNLNGAERGAQKLLTEADVRRIVLSTMNNNPNPQRVQSGYLRSGNFISGQIGWNLAADGTAEFQNVNIGHKQIMVKAGDDVQDAIDLVYAAGGGVVFLRNGTHTLTADLSLYSGVYLVGESMFGTIVDCGSADYSITAYGTDTYGTGTCDATYGSDQVAGNGTTWTAGMAGRSILIDGIWYIVASVESTVALTLASPYIGDTLTTTVYRIAVPITTVKIASLTVQNSTGAGIDLSSVNMAKIDEVYLYNNTGYGVKLMYASLVYFDTVSVVACTNSISLSVCGTIGLKHVSVIGGTGIGIAVAFTKSSTFLDIGSMSNTGDGMSFHTSKNIGLISFSMSENGDDGIAFITGTSTDMQISDGVIKNNVGDGVDMGALSDNCTVANCSIHDNGAYGVTIASGSANNIIDGNYFASNTSGQLSDGGTGNEVYGNIGVSNYDLVDATPVADHTANGPKTNNFNAGESVTIMDLVYLKSDGEWWKTDADATATTDGLLGISLETKTDGNAMKVALSGSFVRDDTWNWTIGATLYVDTATAGGLTATQPSGTDDAIRVIGYAVTADVIWFEPSKIYVTHT